MSEVNRIPNINGQIISVRQLNIPEISIWDAKVPNVNSPYVPVTVYIGKPIVDTRLRRSSPRKQVSKWD